jgi:hypothetical protein
MLGESKEYRYSLKLNIIFIGFTIIPLFLSILSYRDNSIFQTFFIGTLGLVNLALLFYIQMKPMLITSDGSITINSPLRNPITIDIFDILVVDKGTTNYILITYKNLNNETKKQRINLFGMRDADQIYFDHYTNDIIKIINSRTAKNRRPSLLVGTI